MRSRFLVVFGLALPLAAQYAGPAILSRGESPSAMSGPELKFRPYIRMSGVYSTALAGVGIDEQGQLADETAYGMQLGWGVGGVHSWRRTKLGLNYNGSASHYHRNNSFDSLDNTLLLGLTHQVARHAVLSLRQSAGIVQRDFGLLGLPQTVPFDPSESTIPTTDYFNNRTYHSSSLAALTLQRSARLSFNMGGGASLTRRRSQALYGSTVLSAFGDVQYRLSRRATIGGLYQFGHYTYTRIFGGTDVHGVAGTFGFQLSRFVEFSAYAGVLRPETTFLEAVRIDPVIAALLGVTSGTRIVNHVFYAGQYGARISKTMENGVVYLSAGRGLTPGNGLFLTSVSTNVLGGYSYTGLRRWSISLTGSLNRSESIGNIRGGYNTATGSLAVSRTLRHGFNALATYSVRRYSSPSFSGYNRLNHMAMIGFGWSPGPIPLRVW